MDLRRAIHIDQRFDVLRAKRASIRAVRDLRQDLRGAGVFIPGRGGPAHENLTAARRVRRRLSVERPFDIDPGDAELDPAVLNARAHRLREAAAADGGPAWADAFN